MSNKNIWKLGCTWKKRTNPSIYEFIRDKEIILGDELLKYSIGDLVLLTEGFTVKAIAMVKDKPKILIKNLDYSVLFDKYKVDKENRVTYAKAEFYELTEDESFKYRVQRGGCKVNQLDTQKRVINLWNKRNSKA